MDNDLQKFSALFSRNKKQIIRNKKYSHIFAVDTFGGTLSKVLEKKSVFLQLKKIK